MKILFTSDWQATFSNLQKVDATIAHLLEIAGKEGISYIVHGGDIKHNLNPIDGRVLNRLIDFASACSLRKINLLANLGNHDMLATSEGADNFFPVLHGAGVQCFTEPCIVKAGETVSIAFLPFMRDAGKLQEAAADLAARVRKHKNTILVFHAGIHGAKINAGRSYQGDDALPLNALSPEAYSAVFGGHFHRQQEIKPGVWYIGSPFATDWGEANEAKGFLIFDAGTGKIRKIASRIPGMYDPGMKDFTPPKTWAGASVRLKVPVEKDDQNVPAVLVAAKAKAEAAYPGARIFVVPEVAEAETVGLKIRKNASDGEIISDWITSSVPESLSGQQDKLCAYLTYQLAQVSNVSRSIDGVEIVSLEAENILSFERLSIDYENPKGLRLISGRNDDWEGRSNGSGKTSYLQALLVALFGKTLKGQAADRLKRCGISSSAKSFIRATLRLPDGRKLCILRSRQPKTTSLFLDDRDISSGMGDREIQRNIEILTGLTFETVTNALYIDQRDLNRMLTGTDADRKAIFAQFLNLERYQKALEAIKVEAKKLETERREVGALLSVAEASAMQYREFLGTLRAKVKTDVAEAEKRITDIRTQVTNAETEVKRTATVVANLQKKLALVRKESEELRETLSGLRTAVALKAKELARITDLHEKGICPTCEQQIDASKFKRHARELIEETGKAQAAAEAARKAHSAFEASTLSPLESEFANASKAHQRAEAAYESAGRDLKRARAALEALRSDEDRGVIHYQKALLEADDKIRKYTGSLTALDAESSFLSFAGKAFAKDGIPAYISARLYPRLNRSAAYYSQLFTEGEIGVQFVMSGEDIDIKVTNENGGESLDDQSNGETRLASLIVSFVLRDVLAPCNLLIADEPGEGLDERNARQFAAGMRELAERYQSIFLTTHNPVILSELSDVAQLVIRKKNKISEVLQRV